MTPRPSKSHGPIQKSESIQQVSGIPTLKTPECARAARTMEKEITRPLETIETEIEPELDVATIPKPHKTPKITKTKEDIPTTPKCSPKRKTSKPISPLKGSSHRTPYSKQRPAATLILRPTPENFTNITPPHLLSPALIASSSFHHLHPHTYMTYQLQYRFSPTTLPLPFSFHVLLGPLLVNKDWFNATVRVGGHGIAASHIGKNAITGRVPLTRLLLDKLGGLEEEVVIPYLKKELRWIFEQDNEGVPAELEKLKGVRVRVASAKVNISETKDLDWVFYESVVRGSKGRLRE